MATVYAISFVGIGLALLAELVLESRCRRAFRLLCVVAILAIAGTAVVLYGRNFFDFHPTPRGAFIAWATTWSISGLATPFLVGRWILNRLLRSGSSGLRALALGIAGGLFAGWFILPFGLFLGMLLFMGFFPMDLFR